MTFARLPCAWDERFLTHEEKAGLLEIVTLAKSLGVRLYLFNEKECGKCDVFWKKLQIWPTRTSSRGRIDNIVPHACNAVVLGDMGSLGYVSDYEDVFSLWNNQHFQNMRAKLLKAEYPDDVCVDCPHNL